MDYLRLPISAHRFRHHSQERVDDTTSGRHRTSTLRHTIALSITVRGNSRRTRSKRIWPSSPNLPPAFRRRDRSPSRLSSRMVRSTTRLSSLLRPPYSSLRPPRLRRRTSPSTRAHLDFPTIPFPPIDRRPTSSPPLPPSLLAGQHQDPDRRSRFLRARILPPRIRTSNKARSSSPANQYTATVIPVLESRRLDRQFLRAADSEIRVIARWIRIIERGRSCQHSRRRRDRNRRIGSRIRGRRRIDRDRNPSQPCLTRSLRISSSSRFLARKDRRTRPLVRRRNRRNRGWTGGRRRERTTRSPRMLESPPTILDRRSRCTIDPLRLPTRPLRIRQRRVLPLSPLSRRRLSRCSMVGRGVGLRCCSRRVIRMCIAWAE